MLCLYRAIEIEVGRRRGTRTDQRYLHRGSTTLMPGTTMGTEYESLLKRRHIEPSYGKIVTYDPINVVQSELLVQMILSLQ
jgi:hypothetical protein